MNERKKNLLVKYRTDISHIESPFCVCLVFIHSTNIWMLGNVLGTEEDIATGGGETPKPQIICSHEIYKLVGAYIF